MTNEQMRAKIAEVKRSFGPSKSHMAFRQLDRNVSLRTIERWRKMAAEVGLSIETRPDSVYLALPLNGVTGEIRK